jgi:hypothetical protein
MKQQGDLNVFQCGAVACGSAGKWTQYRQHGFITMRMLWREQSTKIRSFIMTDDETEVSSAVVEETSSFETSADELALNSNAIAKTDTRLSGTYLFAHSCPLSKELDLQVSMRTRRPRLLVLHPISDGRMYGDARPNQWRTMSNACLHLSNMRRAPISSCQLATGGLCKYAFS